MRSRALTAVLLVAAVLAAAWIVVSNVRHWGDWLVLGAIVMTAFGGALAIYAPRYPTKKRTFVRTTKPPR